MTNSGLYRSNQHDRWCNGRYCGTFWLECKFITLDLCSDFTHERSFPWCFGLPDFVVSVIPKQQQSRVDYVQGYNQPVKAVYEDQSIKR